MLFVNTEKTINNEDINKVHNFFDEYDSGVQTVTPEEYDEETTISKYLSSLVIGKYEKSIEDIANTKTGNKITRKRNLQQVMRESFYHGANRFGNNFIA